MNEMAGLVLGMAVMAGTPVYLLLQVLAPFQAPSRAWRIASLVPLAFAVPILGWCLYALGQDSNLWPLPFILFAPLGALYLVALQATRVITRAA